MASAAQKRVQHKKKIAEVFGLNRATAWYSFYVDLLRPMPMRNPECGMQVTVQKSNVEIT